MDGGVLIFTSLFSGLFWAEVEALWRKNGRFPRFLSIFRFRMIAKERWVKMYGVLLVLVFPLMVFSLFSKRSYKARLFGLVFFGFAQLVMFLRIFYSMENEKDGF